MNHPKPELLSEYLDGELSPPEAEELEAHLRACDRCALLLRELSEVQRRAGALPDRYPEKDLWPEISRSIRAGGEEDAQVIALHPAPGPALSSAPRRGIRLSYPQAAAAGIVLALLSGVAGASVSGSRPEPEPVVLEERVPMVEMLTSVSPVLGEVAAEVGRLESLLAQHKGRLDPATAGVLEENLGVIDQAIRESLRALESDPENPFLEAHLARSVSAKADYLREATSFVVAMS